MYRFYQFLGWTGAISISVSLFLFLVFILISVVIRVYNRIRAGKQVETKLIPVFSMALDVMELTAYLGIVALAISDVALFGYL